MPQKIDLEELIKNNRNVDPVRLAEGFKLAEELRRSRGVQGSRRSRPFTRRRVRIIDDLQSDPRLTQLSSLRQK